MTSRSDDSNILRLRADPNVWDAHPIISAGAVLPTGPSGAAIALVIAQARLQRGSVAFWARPTIGKSSCISALATVLSERFPGCGIVRHEAKSNSKVVAEGSFIEDMLYSMEYAGKIQRTLAGKREQIRRAQFALGAERRHVILLIDEAQELAEPEFRWLKEQGNWLVGHGFRNTVVLFGQEEIVGLQDYLCSSGRSDLWIRFFQNFYEFEAIKCHGDLVPLLAGCDDNSDYPDGSGLTYTHFLWPEAYSNGFRLRDQASAFWQAFASVLPLARDEHGVAMAFVASALSSFADATRDRDAPHFKPTAEDWTAAVAQTGYAARTPAPSTRRNLPKTHRDAGQS